MKNFINYLSKKSLSLGNGSGLTRKWFGNDAGMTRFSLGSLICVLLLTLGAGEAWGVESYNAIYTVASTSSVTSTGTNPSGSAAYFSQDYTTAGQMTEAKPNSTLTLSGYAGKKITGVKLNLKCTNSKTPTVQIKVGSTDIGSASGITLSGSYTDYAITISSTIVEDLEDITIKIKASGSSVFIQHYTITWQDAIPYDVSFDTGAGNPTVATRNGAEITLPDESDFTPKCSEDGWILYGWTTSAYGSSSTTTAPTTTFVGSGGDTYSPSSDITLYAVYAKIATDETPVEQTLSFTYSSTNWKKYHYESKGTYWLIHGDDGYVESPLIVDLSTITSIDVHAGYFGGSAYGTFQISGAGTNYGSAQACSNNSESTLITVKPASNPLSGQGRIKLHCTGTASDANGLRLKDATIKFTSSPIYYWSAPDCCEDLGEVDGDIDLDTKTTRTLTASWPKTENEHETGYSLQLYDNNGTGVKGDAIGDPVAITGTTSRTHTFTGLTPNHEYFVGVTPTYSGDGDYCEEGTEVTGNATTDAGYTVTYAKGTGATGTMTDSNSPYDAGATVTVLTNTFEKCGSDFNGWSAKKADETAIDVSSGSFTMPASNVTITATWTNMQDKFYDYMHENHPGGSDYYSRSGTYTTPAALDNTTPGDGCEGEHYKFMGWVNKDYINEDGTLKSGYVLISAGATNQCASGATFHAVWATEE